nr:unnamed protein product [Callosobruchus analis]
MLPAPFTASNWEKAEVGVMEEKSATAVNNSYIIYISALILYLNK